MIFDEWGGNEKCHIKRQVFSKKSFVFPNLARKKNKKILRSAQPYISSGEKQCFLKREEEGNDFLGKYKPLNSLNQ